MGMFDHVNFKCPCPRCGATVDGFQSKDCACTLLTLEPEMVANFYSTCPKCKQWIEFRRNLAVMPERKEPLNLDQIKLLGFEMICPQSTED